jgi:histidinol-phosphate aminotransferase
MRLERGNHVASKKSELWRFSGREKLEGKFVGFSSGNAETPCNARKTRLEMLAVAKGVEFGHDFLPVLGAAKEMDEEEIALEAVGIEPAEQGGGHPGVEIQAFPEGAFFKLGGRTVEALTKTGSQVARGLGFRDRHFGAFFWQNANNLEDLLQFLSPAQGPKPSCLSAGSEMDKVGRVLDFAGAGRKSRGWAVSTKSKSKAKTEGQFMNFKRTVSRRKFMGGLAFAAGYLGLRPESELLAHSPPPETGPGGFPLSGEEYDKLAKLSFNENPYGPPESVLNAMTGALKYANRYANPDGGIVEAIAAHHGVARENVLLGAGSTEILDVADETFLEGGKKVISVKPTFASVYEFARGLKSDSIQLDLQPDHRQDIAAMIKATQENRQDIGLVYLCNPNNPTGAIVTKTEVKELLDGIPEHIPVLIDEAYHHFVESSDYATSIPYVIEGRPVIVSRTFSKIVGLAGMRLGYGIAPEALITRMRLRSIGSINAIVKWGGVAALKDEEAQANVKALTLGLREKTVAELASVGYDVIPSEANFFMVNIRRPVKSVIGAFRQRGVLVGRPFPPMNDYLRVTVGNADEMERFMAAFKEILPAGHSVVLAKPG